MIQCPICRAEISPVDVGADLQVVLRDHIDFRHPSASSKE